MTRRTTCENCQFFSPVYVFNHKSKTLRLTEFGECRYDPPRQVENEDRPFPEVTASDWCRCHQIELSPLFHNFELKGKNFVMLQNGRIRYQLGMDSHEKE